MKDTVVALIIATLAILGTAIALYRQGALPLRGLIGVFAVTLAISGFLLVTNL